jgi:WD40 repeat protein
LAVWDATTGKDRFTLNGFMQGPPAWSADGKRLAWKGPEFGVSVYDARDGRRLLSLVGHTGIPYAVGWCLDGKRLASGATDGVVKIWDSTTGDELLSLAGTWLTWSPDGRRLATVGDPDGTIRIYDASVGYALASTGGSEAARPPRIGQKASTAKEKAKP